MRALSQLLPLVLFLGVLSAKCSGTQEDGSASQQLEARQTEELASCTLTALAVGDYTTISSDTVLYQEQELQVLYIDEQGQPVVCIVSTLYFTYRDTALIPQFLVPIGMILISGCGTELQDHALPANIPLPPV